MKLSTYNLNDRQDVSDLICEADNIELKESRNVKYGKESRNGWKVTIEIDGNFLYFNSIDENKVLIRDRNDQFGLSSTVFLTRKELPLLYAQVVTDIVDGYLTMEE